VILLVDLLHRAGSIEYFYTDDGVYPVATHEAVSGLYGGSSLHGLSGDLWFQQLLFVIAAIAAIALILGYRTRLVAIVSLLLLVSLQARNPLVLNGADRLLRVLLFLSILTPLGERWSIDALRRGTARATVVGFSTVALLAQPIVVLTQNAVLKRRGETWYAGEAMEIALANDVMTIYLGNVLASYSSLLAVLTLLWVTLLAGSSVFLLLTSGRVRAFFALVYVTAFIGMLPVMSVGLFPLVLIASVLPFLTTPFWDGVASLVPSRWVTDYRPRPSQLGPLGRRPIERRVLDSLGQRGYGSATSFVVEFGRSVLTVVAVIALVWIVLFGVSHATDISAPAEMESTFPNEQRWGLYSPDPSQAYSWYVAEAQTEHGSTIDIPNGREVTTDRPPDASQEYETFRHRKHMESVRDSAGNDGGGLIAEEYATWVCEEASEYDLVVEEVIVHRLYQPSPIDGEFEEKRTLTLLEHSC